MSPEITDISFFKMQLFAYSLDSLLPLNREVSGSAERATLDDLETLAQYRQAMSIEMEGFEFSLSECREKMRGDIERGVFYVWREGGEIVSTANLEPCSPYAKIGAVYTPPEKRRRGYAISLVHAVCALALRDGLTPILYTNGGYAASNACYIRIGFQKKCALYNIGKS